MKRFAFASSVALLLTCVAAVHAQSKPAQAPATKAAPAPAAAAPAAPAKFVKMLKGTAEIQFTQLPSKKVGNDIVTVLKIKNLSPLAVSLLKVDEYWYKDGAVATGDSQSYRKPFMPGEIIEITMKSPYKASLQSSQYQFSHAGGKVDVKRVKKFD
jgi:flagellar basal body L-ring protein FlgH